MQVGGLPAGVYRLAGLASRIAAQPTSSEAARRGDALRRWRQARARGLTAEQAAQAVGVSRASLYRWAERLEPRSRRPHRLRPSTVTTPALRQAVERLRLDHPMWGRAKLGPLLRAEGLTASDTTVGRVLARLVARGVVQPVPTLVRERRLNRARPKRPHARRLPKGYAVRRPGDLVQLDTLSIALAPGRSIKQFTAYDPWPWTVAAPFDRATARAASTFLDRLVAELPFPVRAIQVDGGSEFMAGFEAACAERNIALFVLPPRSPELNGAVERCNGSWRYEFYACHDLPMDLTNLTRHVQAFQHLYNHHRPHGALAGRTPAQYLASLRAQETQTSQMC